MLPPSLRSKRFRLVLEQRKTEERDFRFWSCETLPFFPTPSPFVFSRHFPRLTLVSRSLLRNCRETLATKASCPLLREIFKYVVKILYLLSTPLRRTIFRTGIKCSSQRDVRLLESQVKTVKKDGDQLQLFIKGFTEVSVVQTVEVEISILYFCQLSNVAICCLCCIGAACGKAVPIYLKLNSISLCHNEDDRSSQGWKLVMGKRQ